MMREQFLQAITVASLLAASRGTAQSKPALPGKASSHPVGHVPAAWRSGSREKKEQYDAHSSDGTGGHPGCSPDAGNRQAADSNSGPDMWRTMASGKNPRREVSMSWEAVTRRIDPFG